MAARLDEQSIARVGAAPRPLTNFCRRWQVVEWGARSHGGESP